jgi:YegS/Rv2252/BmrU family lipid kinase
MSNEKRKIRFIINPKSGIGRQKKIENLIRTTFDTNYFFYEIIYTKEKNHAEDLSREAANQGFDIVVAVGGDGTINEVGRGLLFSNTAMGIIPTGSGNGLAHYLNLPLNLKKALIKITEYNKITIDTASINDKVFISIAGVGYDAHVADKFSKSKKRGFWSYFKIAFLEYIYYNPKAFKIYVNGKTIRTKKFMLCFANSNQFGFNARIAPTARIDDGYIDLCLVRKPRIYYAIFLIPFLFTGMLHHTPFLNVIKAKEFKIIQQKRNMAHIDGDEIDLGKFLEVKIVPQSLKILI